MYTWQQTGSVVAEETACAGFSNATVRNQNLKKNKNLGYGYGFGYGFGYFMDMVLDILFFLFF